MSFLTVEIICSFIFFFLVTCSAVFCLLMARTSYRLQKIVEKIGTGTVKNRAQRIFSRSTYGLLPPFYYLVGIIGLLGTILNIILHQEAEALLMLPPFGIAVYCSSYSKKLIIYNLQKNGLIAAE